MYMYAYFIIFVIIKRTRKPAPIYGDEMYDFYTNFKANNKRRRLKQEIGEDEEEHLDGEEYGEEEETEEQQQSSTSSLEISKDTVAGNEKSKESSKENKRIQLKREITEEPEIIPLENSTTSSLSKSTTQSSRRQSTSSIRHVSPGSLISPSSLYASPSSQESFYNAMSATSSNNHFPNRQYSSNYQNGNDGGPRVIVPRNGIRHTPYVVHQQDSQHQHPQHFPLQQQHFQRGYQQQHFHNGGPQHHYLGQNRNQQQPSIGGFQLLNTSPQALSNVLPQYQDKRVRPQSREELPVQCPECNVVLKNQFSYNTHRNYVHGKLVRVSLQYI